MVKFDAFTNKHLKYFMEKREDIKFPTLKEKRKIVDEFVKNNKVKFKIEEYIIPDKKLFELADTQWVYKEAVNSIDTLKANYKISWDNDCIFIKATEAKFKAFKERLEILLPMLNYLKSIKNTKEPRNIKMYLLLTPLKKELDKNELASPKNINSGYTDFSTNEIFIWREEEFEKVIFHEMIHYMDLDVRNMAFEDEDVPINIDGPKSYYEAFTDLQGIMYYLIYVSIVIGKSVNSLFDIEYQFIKNQAHKLNDVFKLDSWKNDEDNILKKTVKQLSPAFTYYIIKYLIMKKIIETNNYDLLNNPKDLIKEIFKIGFQTGGFTNIRSSRMTLIQMF
jgi:hypothetical protein